MARYGIATSLVSYHEHNADRVGPQLLERMKAGQAAALVSDAGTPLVSDPGYRLVQTCIAEQVPITAIPGASAPLTALILSGLPPERFLFAGFLPPKTSARQSVLSELAAVPATLVFFETVPRLADSLRDMASVLGNRPAAVARELTKLFEEVRRGSLEDLAGHYESSGPPKGEIVVVVGPPLKDMAAPLPEEIDRALEEALAGSGVRDAAAQVALALGLPRRQVYERALVLGRKKT